jgi:hypothetical protein
VVGEYFRFDEKVRNELKNWRSRITRNFDFKMCTHENFLIWATPGAGKSSFVKEIAASMKLGDRYIEINLAKVSQEEASGALKALASGTICMVDEIDAKEDEDWPYEVLLSPLDRNISPDFCCVFILIGSSGGGKEEMIAKMMERFKGKDLLSRIPNDLRFDIPRPSLEDRVIWFSVHSEAAARGQHRKVESIEKFALYYLLVNDEFADPRQVRDLAYSAVGRMKSSDNRLHYNHLFEDGDRSNQEFWRQHQSATEQFDRLYLRL